MVASASFLLLEDTIVSAALLGLSACGLIISLKLLNFPDLSIDGAFALGGAITAISLRAGVSPIASVALAMCAGAVSGLAVAALHCYFGIGKLMAGILMLGVLYSAGLLIMGGANAGLLQYPSVFDIHAMLAGSPLAFAAPLLNIIIAAFPVIVSLLFLFWLLRTRFGVTLRACGSNREALQSCGIDPRPFEMSGMALAGMLPAMAGSLTAQNRGAADVNMGVGLILVALASFLIGRALIKSVLWIGSAMSRDQQKLRQFDVYFSHAPAAKLLLASALLGSLIYQCLLLVAIRCGLWSGGVRFLTSMLVIAFLMGFRERIIRDEQGLF
jgi:putative ABC transport system permease protein